MNIVILRLALQLCRVKYLYAVPFIYGVFVALWPGTAAAQQTSTYTLTEIRSADDAEVLPMPNGDQVVVLSSEMILGSKESEPGGFDVQCRKLGLKRASGEYGGNFYCIARENDTDTFIFQGEFEKQGGIVRILGGTGTWEGAQGSGVYSIDRSGVTRRVATLKIEITRP